MEPPLTNDFEESVFSPIYWNVVFLARPIESWWDVLSPRWARHVLCYGFSVHLQAWVVVNPMATRTMIEVVPDSLFDDVLRSWIDNGAVILRIEAGPVKPSSGRIVQSCSSIVGRIVGVDSAWRPMALFRNLIAQGAEVRHNEHQGEGAQARP